MKQEKRPWTPPQLTVHGTVAAITGDCNLPLYKPGGLRDQFTNTVNCSEL